MSKKVWALVSCPEGQFQLDIQSYCALEAVTPSTPIDEFYDFVAELVKLGPPSELNAKPTLARLLLLAAISGVESYTRSIIAELVAICPVAEKNAHGQPLNIGCLNFYGIKMAGRALLDGVSLAGKDEIQKNLTRVVGLKIEKDESLQTALGEFEKLCHLRHATIHARGRLGAQNLQSVGATAVRGNSYSVSVDFDRAQNALLVCTNVVRALNRNLFYSTLQRWISCRVLTGKWDADKLLYAPLYAVFFSKTDNIQRYNSYQNWLRMRPAILDRTLKG